MKDSISIDFKPFSWNELSESEKITCKQSAEAQEERLFLAQLQQSRTTYFVSFDNGFSYSHVSGVDLYNYLRLKNEYAKLCKSREDYFNHLKEIYEHKSIDQRNIARAKMQDYCKYLEPFHNAIIEAAKVSFLPFNFEITKIVDETTNTVVKI